MLYGLSMAKINKFEIEITSLLNSWIMTKEELKVYLNIVLPNNYKFVIKEIE